MKQEQLSALPDTLPIETNLNFYDLFCWIDPIEHEDKNDAHHMLWPSQSPGLNPFEHIWEILDWFLESTPPSSSKQHLMEYFLEEQGSNPVVQFQRLVKSMQRCIEAG